MSVGLQSQPEPVQPATAITLFSPASAVPDVEDSRSDCTRVSLDVVPLVEDQEEQTMVEEDSKDDAPDEQTRVDGEVRRVPPESEANNSSIYSQPPPENLDKFLAGLRRAQEEQEQLEERLENERLHQELGELEQPRNGKPSPQEDRQDSSPLLLEYRSEEPAHENIADGIVAPDSITHEALVVPLHPGTPEPAVDLHPPPPVTKDIPAPDPSIADLIFSRAVEQCPPQSTLRSRSGLLNEETGDGQTGPASIRQIHRRWNESRKSIYERIIPYTIRICTT